MCRRVEFGQQVGFQCQHSIAGRLTDRRVGFFLSGRRFGQSVLFRFFGLGFRIGYDLSGFFPGGCQNRFLFLFGFGDPVVMDFFQ